MTWSMTTCMKVEKQKKVAKSAHPSAPQRRKVHFHLKVKVRWTQSLKKNGLNMTVKIQRKHQLSLSGNVSEETSHIKKFWN